MPNKYYLGDAKVSSNNAWEKVTEDDGEAIRDIEVLIGVAYPLNISTYLSTGDWSENVQHLIDLPDKDRPDVVWISYGVHEEDEIFEHSQQFCNLVQQLTALGIPFVTASEDFGVSTNNEDGCPPFRVDFMSA